MSEQTLEKRLRNIYRVLIEGTETTWDRLAAASTVDEAATRIYELETTLKAIEGLARSAAKEGVGT